MVMRSPTMRSRIPVHPPRRAHHSAHRRIAVAATSQHRSATHGRAGCLRDATADGNAHLVVRVDMPPPLRSGTPALPAGDGPTLRPATVRAALRLASKLFMFAEALFVPISPPGVPERTICSRRLAESIVKHRM